MKGHEDNLRMNRWLKVLALVTLVTVPLSAQKRRPLSPADIDDIATLLKLEDTRTFDDAAPIDCFKGGRVGASPPGHG